MTIMVTDKKVPVIPKPVPNPITITPTPDQDTVPMEHLLQVLRPIEVVREGGRSFLIMEQAREPSVLRDVLDVPVLRLPIPLHPIVYVNNEVEHSQELRTETDRIGWSDVRGMDILGSPETPSRLHLGMDPAVWVHYAVVYSQEYGAFMRAIANGYLGRINLSAMYLLDTPGLSMTGMTPLEVVPPSTTEEERSPAPKQAPILTPESARDNGVDRLGQDSPIRAASKLNAFTSDSVRSKSRASLPFSSQLKRGASRLPLQTRHEH